MLQQMFYFFGLVFFIAADIMIGVGVYVAWREESEKKKMQALRVDIANLLARVSDAEQRKRATDAFSGAKTLDALTKIKARLVEILVTGPQQQGVNNV